MIINDIHSFTSSLSDISNNKVVISKLLAEYLNRFIVNIKYKQLGVKMDFKKMMDELVKINESIANSEKNINGKITTSEQKVIDHIDSKYNELSEQIVQLFNNTLQYPTDCKNPRT